MLLVHAQTILRYSLCIRCCSSLLAWGLLFFASVAVTSVFMTQRCYAQNDRTLLFLEPVINQWPTQELIHAEWIDDELVVQTAELKKIGLDIPETDPLFAINKIPGLKAVYEPNEQRLYIEVPPEMLQTQKLKQLMQGESTAVESGNGILLNYDIYATQSEQRKVVSMWNELRWFGASGGVVTSTGVYNPYTASEVGDDANYPDYIRYDTQWVLSDPDKLYSIRAGDIVSTPVAGSRPLRLGGVQIARNFNLQPDFISYPLPEFIGSSTVPSSVELYINNLRTYQNNVRPGPFVVETAPYISGAGTAQIVTTDALGRQTTATLPFYVSSELLKPGLTDYSVSMGTVREDYGMESFSYAGHTVVDASLRHGLNQWLTLDAHVEGTSDIQVIGGGGEFRISQWGIANATVLNSSGANNQRGQQYVIGYSYFAPSGGITLQHMERDRDYSDVGVRYGSDLLLRSDQFIAALSLGHGTLSAGYFSIDTVDETKQSYASFSYGRSLSNGASLLFGYNASLDGSGDSSILLSVTIAFGERRSVNSSLTRDDAGNYSAQIAASQTQALGGGWGWGVSAGSGESRFTEVDISWRGDYIGVNAGAYNSVNDTTYWGDIRGSIGVVDNRYFIANFIPDAFALVDTGEFSEVPIRFANQAMGDTDARGLRIIPWLNAYTPNYLEIDPHDLPVDTDIAMTARYVRPAYRSGVRIPFNIEQVSAAIVTLLDARAKPLPPGLDVIVKGTEITGLTGWDGQVYFDNLPRGDIEFESTTSTGRICHARGTYTPIPGTIPSLGPLICD